MIKGKEELLDKINKLRNFLWVNSNNYLIYDYDKKEFIEKTKDFKPYMGRFAYVGCYIDEDIMYEDPIYYIYDYDCELLIKSKQLNDICAIMIYLFNLNENEYKNIDDDDFYYYLLMDLTELYDVRNINSYEALCFGGDLCYEFYSDLAKIGLFDVINLELSSLLEDEDSPDNMIFKINPDIDEAAEYSQFNINCIDKIENGILHVDRTLEILERNVSKEMLLQLKERGFDFDIDKTLQYYKNNVIQIIKDVIFEYKER